MAISRILPSSVSQVMRHICMVFALIIGGGAFAPVFAADALSTEVDNAVTTAMDAVDPGTSKMAPIMTETNTTLAWIIKVLWVVVPLVLLGGLIAYGVWQAKQNEMEAAKKTFIAVALGVIFWFGALAIFF